MDKIKKKEGEWLRLIPEETKKKSQANEQFNKQSIKKGKEKDEGFKQRNIKETEELSDYKDEKKEVFKITEQIEVQKNNREVHQPEENLKTNSFLMIWDLPVNNNIEEIENLCRSIRGAKIDRIKRSKYKALAVIQTEKLEEDNIPWALPIGTHKLARVMRGNEDYNQRDLHNQFTSKLLELPGNVSEVLLLHCLRKKGAKSVYILTNRNGNQRRSATITFSSEEDKEAAQTKPIRFNNYLLF